jgi:subtilisin family serine protease
MTCDRRDIMARIRIAAHTMHDDERDRAVELCENVVVQGPLVLGDIDEERVPDLEAAGAVVEVVGGPPEPVPPAGTDTAFSLAPPPAVSSATATPEFVETIAAAAPPADVDFYLLDLAGPLIDAWQADLAAAGAEIVDRLQPSRYTVRVELAAVPAVATLPFVTGFRMYQPSDTAHPAALSSAEFVDDTQRAQFELLVHRPDDRESVQGWLREHGVEVAGTARRKVRFHAVPGSAVLADLARLPEVAQVNDFVPPDLTNDHARTIMGVDVAAGPPTTLTGAGEVVGIADSGIDRTHPDLTGRIAGVVARGVPGDPDDRHGHGTHVAGSVAGDGTASQGQISGTAPGAHLFFQSIMDATGGLGGLPPDLADLFAEAYNAGARIHNNSWGASAQSTYRMNSLEVDEFVAEHPDFLVVVAAGNRGTAASPRHAHAGFVDLFSLDAPATAKNALTVGASRSDRRVDPSLRWREWSDIRYPLPPIGDEEVCGNPDGMAAFSGRGPCYEQTRMKPDVVAPGTFILSARATNAVAGNFWREHDARYAYMSGTSMATPLVSGVAALVRQYLRGTRGLASPSAALLKAVIINGARWLGGLDAIADHRLEPNAHQGFGMVYLPWTLPNPREPALRLEVVDGPADANAVLASGGDTRQFVVTVGAGLRLRVCLVWTDPPGVGLQNSLTVMLEHSPTRRKWVGNANRQTLFKGPDPGNNVQVIRLDTPDPGTYRIQVDTPTLLRPPQPFSLVVTGDLRSPLVAL